MSQANIRKNRRGRKKNSSASIPQVAGQGAYITDTVLPALRKIFPPGSFERAGRGVGAMAGSAGGSLVSGSGPILSKIGSSLGSRLGSSISRLVGFGDYEVKSNSLTKFPMIIPPGDAIPSFGIMGSSTRVKHREYLGDIVVPSSPTAFTNITYTVNPGDNFTFPWLSVIASQYQQYKFEGLVFEFKTLSSDITSGGALGAVVLASNYDVVQPAFTSKIEMENSQFAVSTKPSCSIMHTMECAPSQVANNLYYVRGTGPVVLSGTDNRFYDLANFQIATQGLPGSSGQVLGELWVSYDVALYKPIMNENPEGAHIRGVSPSNLSIYGNVPTVTGGILNASVNTITFLQPGDFLITIYFNGTGITSGAFTTSGNANFTQTASLYTTTAASVTGLLQPTAPGQTFTISVSGFTTVTTTEVYVSGYSAPL